MAANESVQWIDVNGHYEPGNVRWATREQQSRNRRNLKQNRTSGELALFVILLLLERQR